MCLGMGGIPRRVFVADSFMGVPPARNTSAFQMDEWHLNAQNLYAVQYDTVRASFEELGLLGNSNENNPEKELGFQSPIKCVSRWWRVWVLS